MRLPMALLASALTLLVAIHHVRSLAVMSIDLGTEWMKVGIVSPGVPMEIALNKESKRKTPAVISLREDLRLFGEDAQTVGTRFPKNAYFYLLDLLGKDINHPLVKLYQERFPYYDIVEDTERGTILFKHDDGTLYSPEELVAQLLHKAKEFAEQNARQPIKEAVITVPGYFNQVERKALLQAAKLADIKVLQLINDYMAVALNYGIFRTKDFNETAQYVMFYDMGATSTTATIIALQNVKTKERGYVETHPQISVIGVGYDRTLGGLDLQIKLRDYLGQKFNEMKKTPNDVFKNPRAVAKLFKEAGRVKNILSANADHVAQIEGLLDEKDFRLPVSRDDLERIAGDYFERVKTPVEQALKTAGITIDILNQVVLVGAGTRVPKVQEKLQEIVKMDLAKNLNTDEAATMGAVYKAADLSTGFQVKKFITKDAVVFPIQVVFERETEEGKKLGKRTLFGLMNAFPQKKIITFNKHTHDFTFNLNYADLDYLRDQEVLYIGSHNLTQIDLKGVQEALERNKAENVESKGIKAHFALDESGILNLVNVEFLFEKTVVEEEEEGAFSKLGSTISKLFSGSEDEKPVVEEAEKKEEEEPVPEKKAEDEAPKAETNKTEPEANNKTAPVKDVKPKIVVLKEPLKATEKVLTLEEMNKKQLEESSGKLKKLNNIEAEINRRASALNNLESFVFEVQSKLDEPEYATATTPEEVEQIRAACSEISEWLDVDGSDADADTYEEKLKSLTKLTSGLFMRVFEHKNRPEALAHLKEILNATSNFLEASRNLTKSKNPDKDVYTDTEIEVLEKLIKDTEEWRDKEVEEQRKLKKSDPVKLTVKAISEKIHALDREMKYLVNKIKLWRPKKVEKPVVEEQNETKPVVEEQNETKPVIEEPETHEGAEAADSEAKSEETKPEEPEPIIPNKVKSEENNHSEL